MEADFQRDYGINLMEHIDTMSWRRFVTLYSNLSSYGATAAKADELRKAMKNEPDEERDEEDAAEFFGAMMSTRKGRD